MYQYFSVNYRKIPGKTPGRFLPHIGGDDSNMNPTLTCTRPMLLLEDLSLRSWVQKWDVSSIMFVFIVVYLKKSYFYLKNYIFKVLCDTCGTAVLSRPCTVLSVCLAQWYWWSTQFLSVIFVKSRVRRSVGALYFLKFLFTLQKL